MPSSHKFWKYIDCLITEYSIPKDIIFQNIIKKHQSILSAKTLMQIARNLDVDATCLLTQSLNIESLKNSLAPQRSNFFLPQKYLSGAYSSTTSLYSILSEYKKFGKYEHALRILQIHPDLLTKHLPLSITLVDRALSLFSHLLGPLELTSIAYRNANSFLTSTSFGTNFNKQIHSKPPEDSLFENVHHIEKSWNYSILKKESNSILLRTSQSEEMMDLKEEDYFTNNTTNKIRFEFIKYIINSAGYHCEVRQLSSIGKRGGFHFSLDYQKIKRTSSQKSALPLQ